MPGESGGESADRGEATRPGDADLWGVVALTAATVAVVFVPGLNGTPLRTAVALAFLVFAPGYALVSALFPGDAGPLVVGERPPGGSDDPRLQVLPRVVLAIGASVAAVAAVALTLDFTVWGFQTLPLLSGVSVFTLAAVVIARYRRSVQPPARRFGVGAGGLVARLEAAVLGEGTVDVVLSVVVVLALLLAAGAVYTAPADSAPTREVALLAGSEEGPVAADYPRSLTRGEPTTLFLRLDNGGDRPLRATVLVRLQRVGPDGTVRGSEPAEPRQLEATVPPGQRRLLDHEVVPDATGERLRLTYLVYFGDVPATPTAANADREVHIWVGVDDPATAEEPTPAG